MVKNILNLVIDYLVKDYVIKQKIKKFIKKILYFFTFKSKRINKAKEKLDFFNYENLIIESHVFSSQYFGRNNMYGIAKTVNSYSNKKSNYVIKGIIEHGLYLGNHFLDDEVNNKNFPGMITFSNYREKVLRNNTQKYIFKIGPYIHYSNSYSKIIEEEIKSRYGKILLVFPYHSIKNIDYEYNYNDFIKEIKNIRDLYNFDNVFVNMFWLDIKKGYHNKYREEGFLITTAGTNNDNQFLRRLKTLIQISNFTISNNIGTHTGYINYLDKPHYIYEQKVNAVSKTKEDYKREFGNRDFESTEKIKNKLYKAFSKISFEITKEQKELCNYYWGFDKIKTPNEMNFILTFLDEAFYLMNKKNYSLNEIYNKKINEIKNEKYRKILKESFNGGLDNAEQ